VSPASDLWKPVNMIASAILGARRQGAIWQ
jgi:hypothetical protein